MRPSFFTTVLIALAARVALADIPPACLLHAVNTQDQPADLKAVCGDGANDVQSYLAQNCGQHGDTAQKAFIATCEAAGNKVAPYTGSSSPTSTGSGGSQITGTVTGVATGASSSSTGAAHAEYKHAMSPMAAAAIALVGAVAAL